MEVVGDDLLQGHMRVKVKRKWMLIFAAVMLFARLSMGASPSPKGIASFQETGSAQAELKEAIALTRSGHFSEAIPRLVALQGRVTDEFAVKFNLALCYIATGEPDKSIPILQALPEDPRRGSGVDNLLAQAYIATGRAEEAFIALKRAARITPSAEKLFLYIADACMAYQDYSSGLKAMNLGIQQLPNSASLHYEKAVFLSLLDEFDVAKNEFDQSRQLAPDEAIGYVASAH